MDFLSLVLYLYSLFAGYFQGSATETEYNLNLLKNPSATCLDGSQGSYYWKSGTGNGTDRTLIYFQGGGWCYGSYDPETGASESSMLDSCLYRSGTGLGSSKDYPQTKTFGGMLSTDATKNKLFANWNIAYQPYCDGVARSSDLDEPVEWKGKKLYFRGKSILDSLIDELIADRGLEKMSQVVVAGCSAGGHTVYLHADYIKSRLPKNIEVLAVPDAGFFLDHLDYEGNPTYHEQMKTLFDYTKGISHLNSGCMEKFSSPDDAWKCIFPQYFVHEMETPVFPVQSQYDSWQLGNILRIGCTPENCKGDELKAALAYKEATLSALDIKEFKSTDGIWSEACVMHCHTGGSLYYDPNWEVPENSGYTAERAVREWVTHSEPTESSIHSDSVSYPGNSNCAKTSWDFV
mmetsp:Transcript_58567/g.66786  ORF Transcript_58567/g.66786 Transcript_58567/m.66786 type:complete len:405 (+) Transcript_58567:57-1271(+)